jgi:hypothetical protein
MSYDGSFISEHPECLDPIRAAGECYVVSEAYRAALAEEADAELIRLEGYCGDPTRAVVWKSHPIRWCHTVVRVGELYVDWTARQFDPSHPVPRILTKAQMKEEWCLLTKEHLTVE